MGILCGWGYAAATRPSSTRARGKSRPAASGRGSRPGLSARRGSHQDRQSSAGIPHPTRRSDMGNVVPAVIAVGLLIGADEPKKDVGAKDVRALQGTWKMISLTIDGEGSTERVASSKL